MRDITFRARRTDNGEWVEGNLVWIKNLNNEPYQCFIISHLAYMEYGEFDDTYQVIPETVGQYTGITDKNGKKIFEGDIVYEYNAKGERSVKKYVVMWEDLFVRWSIAECKAMYGNKYLAFYEVIGNIHDNPELLERSKE